MGELEWKGLVLSQRRRPSGDCRRALVEAAGQRFRPFRAGLDYAFILRALRARRSGASYPDARIRILVPARVRSAGL